MLSDSRGVPIIFILFFFFLLPAFRVLQETKTSLVNQEQLRSRINMWFRHVAS